MSYFHALIHRRSLVIFIISTFVIAWVLWYLAGAYSQVTTDYKPLGMRWLLAQAGAYAPALVSSLINSVKERGEISRGKSEWVVYGLVLLIGLAISGVDYGEIFRERYMQFGVIAIAAIALIIFAPVSRASGPGLFHTARVGLPWLLGSVLAIPALLMMAMLATDRQIALAQGLLERGSTIGFALSAATLFAFNLILGGSVGEEPGWRGFALPALLKKYSPLHASLILGLIWALWHAPLDLSHGFMLSGIGSVLARIIWTLPLTLLFTYFYLNSNGSLIIAILLHTSINFSFEFFQPTDRAMALFAVGSGIFFVSTFVLDRK